MFDLIKAGFLLAFGWTLANVGLYILLLLVACISYGIYCGISALWEKWNERGTVE